MIWTSDEEMSRAKDLLEDHRLAGRKYGQWRNARVAELVALADVASRERHVAEVEAAKLRARVEVLEEAVKRLRTCKGCGAEVDADDAWCGCGDAA